MRRWSSRSLSGAISLCEKSLDIPVARVIDPARSENASTSASPNVENPDVNNSLDAMKRLAVECDEAFDSDTTVADVEA